MAIDNEKYNLPLTYDSDIIKEYLGYANAGIGKQRKAAMAASQESQNVMYDTVGKMQLQSERDIMNRRIQAQRSGMTSSQLAAQEMQGIMASQIGMQTINQQYRQEQAEIEAQFAGAEEQTMAGAFELLNANRGNVAAIDAQKYTASGIMQIKEEFPEANSEETRILVKDYLGQSLSGSEKKVLEGMYARIAADEANSGVGATTVPTDGKVTYNNNTYAMKDTDGKALDKAAKGFQEFITNKGYKDGEVFAYNTRRYVTYNGRYYEVEKG
jgi:hypothetical protein